MIEFITINYKTILSKKSRHFNDKDTECMESQHDSGKLTEDSFQGDLMRSLHCMNFSLDFSQSTLNRHMNNAKQKMSAKNRDPYKSFYAIYSFIFLYYS